MFLTLSAVMSRSASLIDSGLNSWGTAVAMDERAVLMPHVCAWHEFEIASRCSVSLGTTIRQIVARAMH